MDLRHATQCYRRQPLPARALLVLALLLLAACAGSGERAPAAEPGESLPARAGATIPLASSTALPLDEALAPVELELPALDLVLPVTAMGWDVVVTDDGLTTEWQVPDDSLGWHLNSAGAGGAGNVLISGHQALGDALLAPLALGELAPGQEMVLTDVDGQRFVYQITTVSEPFPISGATDAEAEQLAALVADRGAAQLTLLTGWPDFTTTHRIVAQADFMGRAATP